MLVRLIVPAIVVFGAAWVLVQPDTPPVAQTASVDRPEQVDAEAAPSSAIDLLGEAWTRPRPQPQEPIVRPLTAAEHAAAISALRQPEVFASAPLDAEPLRRPVPRPAAPVERDTYASTQLDVPPVPSASVPVRAEPQTRWVVRDQGTGAVVAEVPLSEALAILTSR